MVVPNDETVNTINEVFPLSELTLTSVLNHNKLFLRYLLPLVNSHPHPCLFTRMLVGKGYTYDVWLLEAAG